MQKKGENKERKKRIRQSSHPDLNEGPVDLQSTALTPELRELVALFVPGLLCSRPDLLLLQDNARKRVPSLLIA